MSAFGRLLIGLLSPCLIFVAAYSGQHGKAVLTGVLSEKVSATSADAGKSSPDLTTDSRYDEAAAENARRWSEMNWTFGGQAQRGMQIYLPLICRLIDAPEDAGAGIEPQSFAASLARWQGQVGLQPRGVLDQETWSQMIAMWQDRRLKVRVVATPDQLTLVGPEQFYDPARPAELRYVERETYAAYRRLLAAAVADPTLNLKTSSGGALAEDEKFLKIISAYRSPEYQARLRQQSPSAGRAALAVHSPHFTGRALDLYVGGEPVMTKDANRALQTRTKAYQWLVKHAAEFGFYPYFYEPWHWEYRGQ